MNKKKFVTTGEIARICEVSPKTVNAWIERKQIRSFRIGRGPRKITLADLYEFLNSRNFPIASIEELGKMISAQNQRDEPNTLKSTAGKLANSITLLFDIKEYNSSEIAEIISELSDLYRDIGGDGLKIITMDAMHFSAASSFVVV